MNNSGRCAKFPAARQRKERKRGSFCVLLLSVHPPEVKTPDNVHPPEVQTLHFGCHFEILVAGFAHLPAGRDKCDRLPAEGRELLGPGPQGPEGAEVRMGLDLSFVTSQ